MLDDRRRRSVPAAELVRWLNDGQNEILLFRPDALNATTTATLAAGAHQSLDAMGLSPAPAKLLEVTHNVAAGSSKGAIRLVQR